MPEDQIIDVGTSQEDAEAQDALARARQAQEAGETDVESTDDGELDPKVKAKIEKANREAQNLRKKLRELEPLAAKAQELQDAQKTEAQRLSDQLAAQEVELRAFRVDQVRQDAARKVGLDPDLWEFITEADAESATAQAKRLKDRFTSPEPGRADMRQGSRAPAKSPATPNDALRAMLGHP